MTDNSKLTGFDTLSTLRFEGFIERNISEIEQILLNLAKSDNVQSIKNLYINLHNHIHSTNGHNIDMSAYERDFINQLYEVYRRYGNTGSMNDMLLQVEKHISVATNRDIDAGYNTTKAVTAPQFKNVFNKHIQNPQAHRVIYNALVPRATFTGVPTIALMDNNDSVWLDNTPEFWCNHSGTLVLKYRDPDGTNYSGSALPELVVETEYLLLTLQGNVSIDLFMTNHPSDRHKLFIRINDVVQELPRYESLTKDTLVMTYVGDKLYIGTTKEITEITLPDILNVDGIGILMYVHRFIYYPQQATADEIRFLLN